MTRYTKIPDTRRDELQRLLEDYTAARDGLQAAKDNFQEKDAALRAFLGDDTWNVSVGGVRVVRTIQHQQRFDSKAFREAHADLYESFRRSVISPRLTIKDAPKRKK